MLRTGRYHAIRNATGTPNKKPSAKPAIDEIRELFNYPPLPNGDGQHAPLRGEYKFVDDEVDNNIQEQEQ